MAVRKSKAKSGKGSKPTAAEFISRGGATTPSNRETVTQTVRMPADIAARIDAVREASAGVPVSRHHWIIEALAERLEREE